MNTIEAFENYIAQNDVGFSVRKEDTLQFVYQDAEYSLSTFCGEVKKVRLGYVMSLFLPFQAGANSITAMQDVSKRIAHINYSISEKFDAIKGSFDLDWNTGKIAFKFMLESSIEEEDISSLLKYAVSKIDSYAVDFFYAVFQLSVPTPNIENFSKEDFLKPDVTPPQLPEENESDVSTDHDILNSIFASEDNPEDEEEDSDDEDVAPDWGSMSEAELLDELNSRDSSDEDAYLDDEADSYVDEDDSDDIII